MFPLVMGLVLLWVLVLDIIRDSCCLNLTSFLWCLEIDNALNPPTSGIAE